MRETALILHFIGIAMSVGTGFAFMFLGIGSSKMEPPRRIEFMLNASVLGRMGHIGLGLMILSGLYLITPYWSVLGEMPLLIAKLCLVLLLIVLVSLSTSLMRKAKQGNPQVHFPKIAVIGRITLITALTTITLAVLVFR